jgi:hypothetical protein
MRHPTRERLDRPGPALLAASILLTGCHPAPPPGPGAPAGATGTEGARAGHESPAPAGWISLFNGRDLSGWTPKFAGHPLGENHNDTFRAEQGVLRVGYDRDRAFDGAFGHLFYAHPYSQYRLRLEYRFTGAQTPGAPGWAFRNSGVMIHGQAPESMRLDQPFPVSIEVQLLGGDGVQERHTGNLCTPGTHVVMGGELRTEHCIDSTSPTFHGDGWVSLEIEVRGAEVIRHFINGALVMEYSQPQLDPDDPDAAAWIRRRGGDQILSGGSISLQAESHPCEFRNIELLPLE